MTGLSAKTLGICRATWHIPPPVCHQHISDTLYSSVVGYGGHTAGIPVLFLELSTVRLVTDANLRECLSIREILITVTGDPLPYSFDLSLL